MLLAPGTRLGPYEIVAPIGAGGMGAVWRARDTKLNRDVAIKVLLPAVANDPERLARFRREAQVLASLSHPNIAAIYGLEESGDAPALVMELVEGLTLMEVIGQASGSRLWASGQTRQRDGAPGPKPTAQSPMPGDARSQGLPIDQALSIARQIAEALEAAHEQGVIHRDLKPANVKVKADGIVKVLDFGLAKAFDPTPSGTTNLANSPTLSMQATQAGVILGTAGYMSPEQARGRAVDKRTDIWAFGCVLYEMLTGRRPFEGHEVTDVLAKVIEREPDFSSLPPATPPAIQRLLRRSFEKDLKRRLPDIANARIEIDEALASPAAAVPGAVPGAEASALAQVVVPRTTRRERLAWALVAVLTVASIAALALRAMGGFERAAVSSHAYRSSIPLPEGVKFSGPLSASKRLALSPDGTRLAFVAMSPDGHTRLWVRSLDAPTAQPLAGTEGALGPFWSPDSRFIGFFEGFRNGKLKKIAAAGGPAVTLCDFTYVGVGGSWNRDGVILFTTTSGRFQQVVNHPIRRVAASGGAPSVVTTPDEKNGETEHWSPFFLPDGNHFLYEAVTNPMKPLGIYVGSLDSHNRKLLVPNGSYPKYALGYLTFMRDQTVLAQAFDEKRLELRGDAWPLVEDVEIAGTPGRGAYSLSDTGILAYQPGVGGGGASQLVWFDRSGKEIAVLGDQADYDGVELSPDGTRAAVSVLDPARRTRDIWLYDVARGLPTRLTFDPAEDRGPTWAPDGTGLLFSSNRKGTFDLYQKLSSGAGSDEAVLADSSAKTPTSWSADGRFIVYTTTSTTTDSDLWVLPLAGDRKPFPYLRTPSQQAGGRFSPDGRWIAYWQGQFGGSEVYVSPFSGRDGTPGGTWQVSTSGGKHPRWRRDGKEIFYLTHDSKLMAAQVSGQGSAFEVGTVRPLFEIREAQPTSLFPGYDVTGDGQRFLVITRSQQAETTTAPSFTLVVNWTALLKK